MQTLKLVFIFLLMVAPVSGVAHKVNIFATVDDGLITGEVFFADGKFCKNCKVELQDISDKVLGSVLTDENGVFQFKVSLKGPFKIVADAKMGHRAEMMLANDKEAPPTSGIDALNSGGVIIRLGIGIGSIVCFFALWGWVRKR